MSRILLVFLVACAGRSTLTHNNDRSTAIAELVRSRDAFHAAVDELTPEQASFKPSPERWSIAEIAEHITLAEGTLLARVNDVLASTPAPELLAKVNPDDQRVIRFMGDRSDKRQAAEVIRPTGQFADLPAIVSELDKRRSTTIAFVRNRAENFREHATAHPKLGPLDAHQWVLLLASHCDRHTAQILELKQDKNFPQAASHGSTSSP